MRVYELAKELKVDQKELLKELQDMGLDVLNHMSVVGPDDTQNVRERFRAQRAEVVEEKRVTTTVIRRRRKKAPASKDQPDSDADFADGEDEDAGEFAETVEAVEAPEASETVEAPLREAAQAAAPVSEPEDEPRVQAQAAPAEPEPTPPVEVVAEAAEPEPAPPMESVAEAAEPEPAPPAPEPAAEASPEPAAESPAAAPEAQRPPARVTRTVVPEAAPPRAAKPKPKQDRGEPRPEREDARPKPKKRGLDEPARIISRPKQPVAPVGVSREEGRPPAPPLRRGPRPTPQPEVLSPGAVPPPDKGDERSRRRKKGKKGPAIPNDEELMRKAGGRRKSVLDKADLYDAKPGRGRRRGATKKIRKTEVTMPKAIKRRVKVGEAITVGELAKRIGVKAAEMVGRLMKMGMMVTSNQSLDVDDATMIAAEFGFEVDRVGFEEAGLLEQQADSPEDLTPRAPVVTIMGHVDHGKTSLLDTIRKVEVKVVDGEAGGITQHIGAYDVHLDGGGRVVFVDTPGHEAFTQMRARGAQVTDVVVLVVAADDGVMEQTKEAIAHSKAAHVPIVVAVNKVDKPGADPDKVRRQLADVGLVAEDWGGETIFVNVSAKTGQGVPELLEMLELQTDILELAANSSKPARGHVLEARLDKGRGPVGTVLVQEGTLKTGDAFVCGVFAGKVRAMLDDHGGRVDEAGPSTPVEVWGMGGVPEAGDEFAVVEDEKSAKQIAEHRALKKREAELSVKTKMSLDSLFEQMQEGQMLELKLVVKADVQGSVEALVEALGKLGNDLVRVDVIHSGTGAITETDVMLAAASNGIIIGFNVRPSGKVGEVADSEKVDIRTYDVIYKVLEDMEAALTGMLAPVKREEVIGRVEVRDTFHVPKIGTVAGCYVTSGKVERGALARLLRDGVVVATSKVSSLRRFKDDAKEVQQGYECGMGLENYNDIKVGDEIEIFVIREEAAQL